MAALRAVGIGVAGESCLTLLDKSAFEHMLSYFHVSEYQGIKIYMQTVFDCRRDSCFTRAANKTELMYGRLTPVSKYHNLPYMMS